MIVASVDVVGSSDPEGRKVEPPDVVHQCRFEDSVHVPVCRGKSASTCWVVMEVAGAVAVVVVGRERRRGRRARRRECSRQPVLDQSKEGRVCLITGT